MTTTTNTPVQKFKHGDKAESLPVRYDPEGQYYYSSLKDIRYAFDSASQFRVNGSLILFLEDSNGRWHVPPRVAHYPDDIVEISKTVRSPDPSYSSGSIFIEVGDTPRPTMTISEEIRTGLGISAGTSPPPPATPMDSKSSSTPSTAISHAEAKPKAENPPVRPPSIDEALASSQPPSSVHFLPPLNLVPFSRLIEGATDKANSSHLPTRTTSLAADRDSLAATAKFDTPLSRSNSTSRRPPERPPRLGPIQPRSKHSPSSSVSSSVSYSSQSSGKTTLTSNSISARMPLLPTSTSGMSSEFNKRFSVISNDAPGLSSEMARISNLINNADDRKSEEFGELLRFYGRLVSQERYVFEQRLSSQNLLHLGNPCHQRHASAKQDITDRTLDATLGRSYEMNEYNIPKFFVILPGFLDRFDPKLLSMEKFRLYFLCECDAPSSGQNHQRSQSQGSPTSPTSPSFSQRRIHLHGHDGYAITRPNDFLKRYGAYVLGLLKVLKYCLRTVATTQTTFRGSLSIGEPISSVVLEDIVDCTISFFRQKLEAFGVTQLSSITGPNGSEQDDSLPSLDALGSADLQRLTTFLRYNNADRTLGNLYRISTNEGGVQWVCYEHYCQSLHNTNMNAFSWILQELNGAYDPHHRKVTITLTSSADAKTFFETFARQATHVDELDVVFEGWNFWASDLEHLVKSVCQTNVKSLKLDLKDSVNDTISEISARFTPGSKYQPLFDLLWNRKLQGFSLIGAGGFGLRTSDFPMGQHFSYLQSFHFLHAIKTSDQLRLMKILTYCRNLTDLRLGDYVNWSKIRQELVSVMAAMEYIRTLHLYSVQGQSGGSVSGLLCAFANKATPLKELVCYVGRVNEWELGEVIRSLSRRIEVLIVEQVQPPFMELVPTATNTTPTGSSTTNFQRTFTSGPLPSPFSRLTHLDLNVRLSPQSMGYLEVILKDLNLVHLGLTSLTKSLLDYVNYPTLRSVSLLDFEEADLKPLKDYVQNCNNPTHLEVISLQGAKFSNPWKFAPLLNTLTLRRLQLSGMSSPELKGTISVMNMTRLECLVLVGCHYDWAVEETLAAKRAEFRPELLLHVSIATREGVSHQQAVEEKGIDKVESREACDTAVKLAARRVRFYSEAELVLLGKPLLGVF